MAGHVFILSEESQMPPALPYILSCYISDYTQIHLRLHLHMHFQILKLNNVELEIFVLEKLCVGNLL